MSSIDGEMSLHVVHTSNVYLKHFKTFWLKYLMSCIICTSFYKILLKCLLQALLLSWYDSAWCQCICQHELHKHLPNARKVPGGSVVAGSHKPVLNHILGKVHHRFRFVAFVTIPKANISIQLIYNELIFFYFNPHFLLRLHPGYCAFRQNICGVPLSVRDLPFFKQRGITHLVFTMFNKTSAPWALGQCSECQAIQTSMYLCSWLIYTHLGFNLDQWYFYFVLIPHKFVCLYPALIQGFLFLPDFSMKGEKEQCEISILMTVYPICTEDLSQWFHEDV